MSVTQAPVETGLAASADLAVPECVAFPHAERLAFRSSTLRTCGNAIKHEQSPGWIPSLFSANGSHCVIRMQRIPHTFLHPAQVR